MNTYPMLPTQSRKALMAILVDRQNLPATAITDQAHFKRDLALDSLDIAELMLEIELRLDVKIPDEQWHHLATVGELIRYLETEMEPRPVAAAPGEKELLASMSAIDEIST